MNRWEILLENTLSKLIMENTATPGTSTPGTSTPGIEGANNIDSQNLSDLRFNNIIISNGNPDEFKDVIDKLFGNDIDELLEKTHYRNIVQDVIFNFFEGCYDNQLRQSESWEEFEKTNGFQFMTNHSLKKDLYKKFLEKVNPYILLPSLSYTDEMINYLGGPEKKDFSRIISYYWQGMSKLAMEKINEKGYARNPANGLDLYYTPIKDLIEDERIYAGIRKGSYDLATLPKEANDDDSNWKDILPPLTEEEKKYAPKWILHRKS